MSLKDLCASIRMEIVSRNFPPGMKLSEQLLGSRWKVSRTPIREALRHLESEGFISSSKHKGFIVTSISMHDVEQIYTILITLDSLAGKLATPAITSDSKKLERLRKLCTEMKELCEKRDIEGYMRKNLEFHTMIFRSSENAWIVKILENLHSHTNRFILNALYIPHRIENSVQEHFEILSGIEKGNEKGVEKAIAAHFTRSLNDLRAEIRRINRGDSR
ncbi:MAG: GntR family transcriptional regulator [Syntrophales bacterium]|nr:GntR family transcriptional regulator [Syntrophales bacterium]